MGHGGAEPMTVQRSPETESVIRKLIESGRYSDPTSVLDEAVRVLDERDRLVRLKAAIASGDDQYARGEAIPFTPELVEQIRRDAEQMARKSTEPNLCSKSEGAAGDGCAPRSRWHWTRRPAAS
jgi:Arc/MetJ-type ribon-helix-helix transcriptional regulator